MKPPKLSRLDHRLTVALDFPRTMSALYTTDEYGRPFIIIKEQDKKQRVTGLAAQKVHITFNCLSLLL
jgi:hypothetical protein